MKIILSLIILLLSINIYSQRLSAGFGMSLSGSLYDENIKVGSNIYSPITDKTYTVLDSNRNELPGQFLAFLVIRIVV